MNPVELLNASAKVGVRRYQGSSLRRGTTYHELPFDEFKAVPSHRKNTIDRWNLIKTKSGIDFQRRTLLDLGCSVGAFCLLAAKEGCREVIGIDYDEDSINFGKFVAARMGHNNIKYFCKKLAPNSFEEFPIYDITLWLSHWMWIVKQYGIEAAKDMMYNVSLKTNILVFESAADDAMAAIKGATQDNIKQWLAESIIHADVEDIGFIPAWNARHIFVCKRPLKTWRNAYTSVVNRINRTTVRKTYKPQFKWMAKREVECYRRLEGQKNFPRVVGHGDGYIDLPYCGSQQNIQGKKDQCETILLALEAAGLKHNDINPKNLLTLNNTIHCIDMGWATMDNEKDTPVPMPSVCGGKYYANNKGNDRKAMEISIRDGVYK